MPEPDFGDIVQTVGAIRERAAKMKKMAITGFALAIVFMIMALAVSYFGFRLQQQAFSGGSSQDATLDGVRELCRNLDKGRSYTKEDIEFAKVIGSQANRISEGIGKVQLESAIADAVARLVILFGGFYVFQLLITFGKFNSVSAERLSSCADAMEVAIHSGVPLD